MRQRRTLQYAADRRKLSLHYKLYILYIYITKLSNSDKKYHTKQIEWHKHNEYTSSDAPSITNTGPA